MTGQALERPGHAPAIMVAADGARRASEGSGPVERVRTLPVALPCLGCQHAAVCSIRPGVEALRFTAPTSPHEAVHVEVGRITITCNHRTTARARGHKVDGSVVERALTLMDGGAGLRAAAKATGLHYATLSRYARQRKAGG